MSPVEIVAIVALVCWALYKQTHVSPVTEKGRFKMALIYGIVGLCVGGFDLPSGDRRSRDDCLRRRAQRGRRRRPRPPHAGVGRARTAPS